MGIVAHYGARLSLLTRKRMRLLKSKSLCKNEILSTLPFKLAILKQNPKTYPKSFRSLSTLKSG